MIIECRGLSKSYRKYATGDGMLALMKSFALRRYESVDAVHEASFKIEEGTSVGLLGANGAGKTTLVKMLAGLLVPSQGAATVMGYTPWHRDNEYLRRIGVVMGQRQQLWIDVSAAENLRLNQVIYRIPQREFKSRLKSLAEMLDVTELLNVQVRKLSLGEKMKMELLAAFLHRPKLLFLDEPTIGLDIVAQTRIRAFIRERVAKDGVTVLLTSHYVRDLEELCPRVMLIRRGRIVHDGKLTDIAGDLAGMKRVAWAMAPGTSLPDAVARLKPKQMIDGHRFVEVSPKEVPALVRVLVSTPGIEDLSIEAPPLEESVREALAK
jgi:ABC-2 type transport system ATP-binding protein